MVCRLKSRSLFRKCVKWKKPKPPRDPVLPTTWTHWRQDSPGKGEQRTHLLIPVQHRKEMDEDNPYSEMRVSLSSSRKKRIKICDEGGMQTRQLNALLSASNFFLPSPYLMNNNVTSWRGETGWCPRQAICLITWPHCSDALHLHTNLTALLCS